jgi:hypothetical protein
MRSRPIISDPAHVAAEHYGTVLDEAIDQMALAERVADLAEAGLMLEALELLAREGDPAAKADARQALERCNGRRGSMVRRGSVIALAVAALAAPSIAGAATFVGTPITTPTVSPVKQAPASVLQSAKQVAYGIVYPMWKEDLDVPAAWDTLVTTCTGPERHITCVTVTTAPAAIVSQVEGITALPNGTFRVGIDELVYVRVAGRGHFEHYTGCGPHGIAVCA